MSYHAFHCRWLCNHEAIVLFGFATGRVNYEPEAKWLYSFRVFLGVFKVEILWKTGCHQERVEMGYGN